MPVMSLHCTAQHQTTNTQEAQCCAYVDMNVPKQVSTVSPSMSSFTQEQWQVAGRLQLHTVSVGSIHLPCVSAHLSTCSFCR